MVCASGHPLSALGGGNPTCPPPGCVWATTMTNIYTIEGYDGWVYRNPTCSLDVYINDITMATTSSVRHPVL